MEKQFAFSIHWGIKFICPLIGQSAWKGWRMRKGTNRISRVLLLPAPLLCLSILWGGHVWSKEGTQKWDYRTGGEVASSPAIGADGTIYVGSDDGCLYAIGSDGAKKWTFKTGGSMISSPAVGSDGTIYVGSGDGCLYAIDRDGALKWAYQTKDAIYSSPVIARDGTIYVASWDHHVYALSPAGLLRWTFETGNSVFSSPAIGPDGTIYVGSSDGRLYAIGAERPQAQGTELAQKKSAVNEAEGGDVVKAPSSEVATTVAGPARTPPGAVAETKGRWRLSKTGPDMTDQPDPRLFVGTDDFQAVTEGAFREIRGIRFEAEEDGEERVVFLLNGVFSPKVLTLDGERPRVICDFAGARLASNISREIPVMGATVQQIRTALYGPSDGRVKVVLDINPEAGGMFESTFFDEEYVYSGKGEYLYMFILKPDRVKRVKSPSAGLNGTKE